MNAKELQLEVDRLTAELANAGNKISAVAIVRNVNVPYDKAIHELIIDPYTAGAVEALAVGDKLTVRIGKANAPNGKPYVNLSDESWLMLWSHFINF